MISVPFSGEEYQKLERLLELKSGEPVTAAKILIALGDAVELSLTLSRGSSRRRGNALVADAEKRTRAASTRMP